MTKKNNQYNSIRCVKQITLYGCFILFCSSCVPFSNAQKKWKKDSTGCNKERLEYSYMITKDKENYIGLKKGKLIQLLGKPNLATVLKTGKERLYYYIDEGAQCSPAFYNDKEFLKKGPHATSLNFIIENKKVKEIYVTFS